MKLNCKQGDLAVLTYSIAGNEGKIVRCVRLTKYRGCLGEGPHWNRQLASTVSNAGSFGDFDEH